MNVSVANYTHSYTVPKDTIELANYSMARSLLATIVRDSTSSLMKKISSYFILYSADLKMILLASSVLTIRFITLYELTHFINSINICSKSDKNLY